MENNLAIQPIEEPKQKKKGGLILIIIFFAVALGVSSGFALSKSGLVKTGAFRVEQVNTSKEVGVKDAQNFKDSGDGKLVKGGIDGEGTHHLVRAGGTSQTVYITSSVVDLDKFIGKKVKVFGQTFASKTAGWLMDVGRIEIK